MSSRLTASDLSSANFGLSGADILILLTYESDNKSAVIYGIKLDTVERESIPSS